MLATLKAPNDDEAEQLDSYITFHSLTEEKHLPGQFQYDYCDRLLQLKAN